MDIQAWITAIATLTLAILTVRYVLLTGKILKSNEKTNKELLRPYIVVDMITEDLSLFLIIRNIGKRPANKLSIDIKPELDDILYEDINRNKKMVDYKPILNQSFFSPGYEIKFALNYNPTILELKNPEKNYEYSIHVEYLDDDEIKYEEKYNINLDSLLYEYKIANFTSIYYLQKFEMHLKEMTKQIECIGKQLKP